MVRPGDWVRVTGAGHRGLTGPIMVGPTTDGVVYVRVRVTASRQALLAVRVENVVRVAPHGPQPGPAQQR